MADSEKKPPAADDEKKPSLEEAIVARGRTLQIGRVVKVTGDKVRLERGEITRLRKLGFLEDPNAVILPRGNGPSFDAAGGVKVQKVA
jgi:hypothetical protein